MNASSGQFPLLLEQIRRGEIPLPSVPTVVSQLRALIVKPNAEVADIANLIERDAPLAGQLLRLSNTVAYAHLGRNNSIKSALGRIGLRQVQSLVETIASRQHQQRASELRPLQARISQYSLARAIALRALAELLGKGGRVDPELAYMSGLLADTGASFLLSVVGERAGDCTAVATEDGCREFLQSQHEDVGGRILELWAMHPAVVLVARNHHAGSAPVPPSDYWSLAVAGTELTEKATGISDELRRGERRAEVVERCALGLLSDAVVMRKMQARVRDEFESISEALS